jgi:hypothetical protein
MPGKTESVAPAFAWPMYTYFFPSAVPRATVTGTAICSPVLPVVVLSLEPTDASPAFRSLFFTPNVNRLPMPVFVEVEVGRDGDLEAAVSDPDPHRDVPAHRVLRLRAHERTCLVEAR